MIYLLTGRKHSGKTSFLKRFVKEEQARGRKFYGILSEHFIKGGKIWGYNALDVESGESFLLSRRKRRKNWQRAKIYYLNPKAVERISKVISARRPGGWTLVIDEIGSLEVKYKKGIWKAARAALEESKGDIIVVAQQGIVKEFLHLL